jgi:hypothetical protein
MSSMLRSIPMPRCKILMSLRERWMTRRTRKKKRNRDLQLQRQRQQIRMPPMTIPMAWATEMSGEITKAISHCVFWHEAAKLKLGELGRHGEKRFVSKLDTGHVF